MIKIKKNLKLKGLIEVNLETVLKNKRTLKARRPLWRKLRHKG